MPDSKTIPISIWARYSKKLSQKIENPRHAGFFTADEATERGMRLVIGKAGRRQEHQLVCLYFLVDESDGVFADAKFQVFGPASLIGAAESACALLIRKNYDQARKVTADLIDKQLRDSSDTHSFAQESSPHLQLVLDAIECAAQQCFDIPFAEAYVPTPLGGNWEKEGSYPGWKELNREQKIAVIEEVIDSEIRPYIALDAGGVQIIDLVEEKLIIGYEGACTSCYSATGSTLNAIQGILRSKVSEELIIVPDASFLSPEITNTIP